MTEKIVSRAQAPVCSACGAPLPVEISRETVQCHHCGAVIPVDEKLRNSVRAYVGDIEGLVKKELSARINEAYYSQEEKYNKLLIGGIVGFATFLAFAFTAGCIASGFNMGIPVLYFSLLLGGHSFSLFAIIAGIQLKNRLPRIKTIAAVGIVRCDECGAVISMRAGQALAVCPYCGSHLLVPCSLAASLLEDTRVAYGKAESDAGESLTRATMADERTADAAPWIVTSAVFGAAFVVLALGKAFGTELGMATLWYSILATSVAAAVIMWVLSRRGSSKIYEFERRMLDIALRAVRDMQSFPVNEGK